MSVELSRHGPADPHGRPGTCTNVGDCRNRGTPDALTLCLLGSLATNAPRELHVLGHDRDALVGKLQGREGVAAVRRDGRMRWIGTARHGVGWDMSEQHFMWMEHDELAGSQS